MEYYNNKSLDVMEDIAIYGAGGFGREVACLLNIINKKEPTWNFIGFFDDGEKIGDCNEYGEVLGGFDELNTWDKPLSVVFAIATPSTISRIVETICNSNIDYPNLIAPTVTFLDKSNMRIGQGNIICSNCFVSCNVSIGNFNIFNGYIPIGHDTCIGDYNVIMPSVNISGGVQIGNGNFFGVQSVVLQNLKIGNNVRIGTGSVIMRNTKDDTLYIGNPAVKMKL